MKRPQNMCQYKRQELKLYLALLLRDVIEAEAKCESEMTFVKQVGGVLYIEQDVRKIEHHKFLESLYSTILVNRAVC